MHIRKKELVPLFLVLALVGLGMQPSDKYKIEVRYHILAPRDQHVALYKTMVGHLDKLGFDFEPKLKPFPNTDYEDPAKTILAGTIDRDKALGCLNNPSVASLLLMPVDFELPAEPAKAIPVRLELAGGFPSARQFQLANQARALLQQLGFKESVGYDHRGYTGKPFTRIVGTIPAEHLKTLLKDLRTQPTGWLTPHIDPETLPAPVNSVVPIMVTEVLPETDLSTEAPPAAKRGQDYLDKISPALWALVTSKDDDTKIVRAEIILSYVPPAGDERYRASLMAEAPSLFIEGRLGPVVTGLLRVNQAGSLAGLPQVSVVRLARQALVGVDPSVKFAADNRKALRLSGLDGLHSKGFKGKGVRLGIVDSDFRGYKNLVQSGQLPKNTHLVDMTTEFNSDFYADPEIGDDKAIGHGTHCALAAALAAPEAELTLIRIDPTSLLQMKLVAQIINGGAVLDDHLLQRIDELHLAADFLAARRDELIKDRQPILDNFEDDREQKLTFEILGSAVRGWLFTPREWIYARVLESEREGELQRQLEKRFQRFYDDLRKLQGIQIVSTSLVWNDGYPLGGGSPLSQWFEECQQGKSLWFVSAGNTRGQTWTGPYRDVDRNGVMEFAEPKAKLPAGTWTPELNFLAWQPHGVVGEGESHETLELPQGAKVRITMQWREPHDPSYFWYPKELDRYLKPLADVSLLVLRQRETTGKTAQSDRFELAARSPVSAFRIENQPAGSTYEQIVEFTVPKAGRYALRVERRLPTDWELALDEATGRPVLVERPTLSGKGIRPADAPNLPAVESQWELRPRIFVSVIDPSTAAKGRVVFRDFWSNDGSIPLMADTRSLIAVGAANFASQPRPYAATGSPGTLWNFQKPNLLAYDGLMLTSQGTGSAYGSSLATPLAAGMAATLLSAGERVLPLQSHLQKLQGAVWQPR